MTNRRRRRTKAWGLGALLLAVMVTADGTVAHPAVPPGPKLGDPIPGLTVNQLAAFERGRDVFERRFTPSEGLGPFYNATSCASCHSTPVMGGGSDLYRNFYLAVYQFGATTVQQSSSIPPFLSQVVPAFGSGDSHMTATFTLEGGRPLIPDTWTGFPVISAQRNAIPVFGVGLFELISNETILANHDPADLNGDGISGQINTQFNGSAIGRMGLKAQVNNIEIFTRGPLQNQMGITSNPFEGSAGLVSFAHAPMQVGSNPDDPETDNDGIPDPEISPDDLVDLIAFGKFIAPPAPRPFNQAALNGEVLFDTLNCTGCHIPSLPSSGGPVNAYTDLLLHNMGTAMRDNILLGDNIASVNEFRTQPLWGVSKFPPYLHDGRAATLTEAILAHGGEAQTSRDDFVALTAQQQAEVIAFLEHL
ncbi:MAG: di-heme oxidoredictase family protein [Planctomycetota bacterium]